MWINFFLNHIFLVPENFGNKIFWTTTFWIKNIFGPKNSFKHKFFKLRSSSFYKPESNGLTRQLAIFNSYQPESTRFNPINVYQPVSTCINLQYQTYQPVSTRINLYRPVLTCINLYQPGLTRINQKWNFSSTKAQIFTKFETYAHKIKIMRRTKTSEKNKFLQVIGSFR